MDYQGILIEESLTDPSILKTVEILKTDVELITERHKTPWLRQWTLHTVVKIPEEKAKQFAEQIRSNLDTSHSAWYADFKNDKFHYIIFQDKVFKIDRTKKEEYQKATRHGIALGIPGYQLDFSPQVVVPIS